MIFCGAKCDRCGRIYQMNYTSRKTDITKEIRKEGWSVGQRTLCKDCRPNSEKTRYRKIKNQINIKWVELKPAAYQKKKESTLNKIRKANLSLEHRLALEEQIWKMDVFYKIEREQKLKNKNKNK